MSKFHAHDYENVESSISNHFMNQCSMHMLLYGIFKLKIENISYFINNFVVKLKYKKWECNFFFDENKIFKN